MITQVSLKTFLTSLNYSNKGSYLKSCQSGIGPKIMEATLQILKEAGVRLDIEEIENLYDFDGTKGYSA